MPEASVPVNIFDFTDFREFLSAYYTARKARDAIFTHRFISSQVRTGSAGWFSDILKGRTNLSTNHLLILIKLLRLDPAQSSYFEALVHYDQAGSMEEKSRHYKQILGLKGVKAELIGSDRFEFYSEWYHSALRELLLFHPFRGDYAALGKKMNPAITSAAARKSVLLLEKLGLVRKVPSGGYQSMDITLKKDPGFKAVHLAQYLKANCALGTESLDLIPKEERDISAMTLSLSKSGFLKAKEEIRAMRERLLALAKDDEDPEKVYQCNFHLFPVTR